MAGPSTGAWSQPTQSVATKTQRAATPVTNTASGKQKTGPNTQAFTQGVVKAWTVTKDGVQRGWVDARNGMNKAWQAIKSVKIKVKDEDSVMSDSEE